jgi:hypothetical protein
VQEDTKSREKDAEVEPKEAEEESLAYHGKPKAVETSHRQRNLLEAKRPLAKSLKK